MPSSTFFDINKAYTGGYGDFSSKANKGDGSPSWLEGRNFESPFSASTAFNLSKGGSDEDRTGWYKMAKENLYDIARKKREKSESSVKFGQPFSGGGGEIVPGLGFLQSPQHPPFVLEGTQGDSGGLFGSIGGLAGSLGAAAGIFGPLGAPIGAAVGGLIDRARG
jgi:hypothetical protein